MGDLSTGYNTENPELEKKRIELIKQPVPTVPDRAEYAVGDASYTPGGACLMAYPVALPVALPVKRLMTDVSLQLRLLALGSFLLGYLVLPVLGAIFLPENSSVAAVMSLICPFFSIAVLFVGGTLMSNGSLRCFARELELRRFPFGMLLLGIPLSIAIAIGSGMITTVWQLCADKLGWAFGTPPTVDIMTNQTHLQVAALAVTALLAAPLYEEIIFRRVLFGTVYRRFHAVIAFAVTALCFGSVHFSLLQLPGFLFMSTLWQYFYMREKNLWVSIILHFFNNLIAVSALLLVRYGGTWLEMLKKISEQA